MCWASNPCVSMSGEREQTGSLRCGFQAKRLSTCSLPTILRDRRRDSLADRLDSCEDWFAAAGWAAFDFVNAHLDASKADPEQREPPG